MISIDGRECSFSPGQTLLKAARENGFFIPTLCHHPALSPYGSCRLCVVEVNKDGTSRLEAACTYPAAEGLIIETASSRVLSLRKMILELLLARCPEAAELKNLGKELGAQPGRLPVSADEDCILCGLCVRACREAVGKSAIGFTRRGPDRKVSSPFNSQSEDCLGCTACVHVCPTGAVKTVAEADSLQIPTWNTELVMARCRTCGASYTPVKAGEHAWQLSGLPPETAGLCAPCRRRAALAGLSGFDFTSTRVIFKK
jgi:NADH dehydrogenase/NADH:ubiquinone oxidoreductase subunit G